MRERHLRKLMRKKEVRRGFQRDYGKNRGMFGWIILVIGVILVLKDIGVLPSELNFLYNNVSVWAILIILIGIVLVIRGRN